MTSTICLFNPFHIRIQIVPAQLHEKLHRIILTFSWIPAKKKIPSSSGLGDLELVLEQQICNLTGPRKAEETWKPPWCSMLHLAFCRLIARYLATLKADKARPPWNMVWYLQKKKSQIIPRCSVMRLAEFVTLKNSYPTRKNVFALHLESSIFQPQSSKWEFLLSHLVPQRNLYPNPGVKIFWKLTKLIIFPSKTCLLIFTLHEIFNLSDRCILSIWLCPHPFGFYFPPLLCFCFHQPLTPSLNSDVRPKDWKNKSTVLYRTVRYWLVLRKQRNTYY